ncbi:hypothetical protein V8E36_006745 [Tilletia maclaganii]
MTARATGVDARSEPVRVPSEGEIVRHIRKHYSDMSTRVAKFQLGNLLKWACETCGQLHSESERTYKVHHHEHTKIPSTAAMSELATQSTLSGLDPKRKEAVPSWRTGTRKVAPPGYSWLANPMAMPGVPTMAVLLPTEVDTSSTDLACGFSLEQDDSIIDSGGLLPAQSNALHDEECPGEIELGRVHRACETLPESSSSS